MNIIVLAHLFRIPPPGYGGVERVVYEFVREMADRGHEVHLIATNAAQINGVNYIQRQIWGKTDGYLDGINQIKRMNPSKDYIVIDNNDLGTIHKDRWEENNYIFVCHGADKRPEGVPVIYPSVALVKRMNREDVLGKTAFMVHHGFDTKKYYYDGREREDFLLWIGSHRPMKASHLAIEIALRTNKKLIMIGPEQDRNYYKEKVKPYIDGDKIVDIGERNDKDKIDFYQRCKALLFPTACIEVFGMVVVEAQLCGAPVIAQYNNPHQPLFELTTDYSLYEWKTTDEAVVCVQKLYEKDFIDNKRISDGAKCRFSVKKMCNGYENVIYKLFGVK